MDQRPLPEAAADGRPQCLGPVDHEEQALVGREPALHQVLDQRRDKARVLGGALADPEQVLRAGAVHPQRRHDRPPLDLDAVDEHRADAGGHGPAQKLGQARAGEHHETAGDRALGGPARRLGNLRPHRLQARLRVAAGGDPGQHAGHRELREQVAAGQRPPGGKRHLLALQAPDPRPGDGHPPSAQRERGRLAAVAVGAAPGVVAPARAHQQLYVLGKHLVQHGHPGAHRQRQKALADDPGHLGHGQRELRLLRRGHVRLNDPQASLRYLLHSDPPRGVWGDTPTLPQRRGQGRIATSTSTGSGTTPVTLRAVLPDINR